jgi:hypothetical protein
MSEKEYLKRDVVKQEEQTWCRITDDGRLEYLDWVFIEQQAALFDQAGSTGVRDNVMTMCKIAILARQQTLERAITLLSRFATYSNDTAAVTLYDPINAALPKPATFVFFHVGDDTTQPARLIDSIEKTNPGARIIMLTDKFTPALEGVVRCDFDVDRDHLMTERLRYYTALELNEPAVYLDTDMVVRGFINLPAILGDKKYTFCARSFDRMIPFNGQQRGLDFSEHHDRPIGLVFPYVACFIAARTSADLLPLFDRCRALDDKYQQWYGDQEALREFINTLKVTEFNLIEEAVIACLPEYIGNSSPLIVHYKGARKNVAA